MTHCLRWGLAPDLLLHRETSNIVPGPDSFVAERAELENHPEKSVKNSLKERVKAVFRLAGGYSPDPFDDRDEEDNDGSQHQERQNYLLS